MPMKPYKDIKCGTYSGYQRHYRLKESACTECKAAASKYSLVYYHKNKDKIKKNPARKARRIRQKVRRKALLRGNKFDIYTMEQVLDLYGITCYLCDKAIDMDSPRNCIGNRWEFGLHIDHLIPISKGGADTLENVRPTHALCNINKGARNAEKPPTQDFS